MIRAHWKLFALALIVLITGCAPAHTPTSSPAAVTESPVTATVAVYAERRETMVKRTIEARGVSDPEVLSAMRAVPRHRFVSQEYEDQAYEDHPLPIGYGQTISQPYIVAWMTELLELEPGDRVLEIGTGSGYQAAVLAELEDIEVYTIEIVPELAEQAKARLEAVGYTDIQAKQGDGYHGWPEHAPYDAAYLTCAAPEIPEAIVEQLRVGGRLIAPIGTGRQTLVRAEKAENGLDRERHGAVRFVRMQGD